VTHPDESYLFDYILNKMFSGGSILEAEVGQV